MCSKDGDEALLIFLWDGYEEVSGQVCKNSHTKVIGSMQSGP